MRSGIALLAGLVILVLVNLAIYQKENHLATGEVIYLELAPVDPRSLMQGDYMTLRFEVGNRIRQALRQSADKVGADTVSADQGYAVVRLDERGVAHFVRLQASQSQPLADDERRLYFRYRKHRVHFATNAFFFQEGQAERYEAARYGRFRLNDRGEPLLVGLHDGKLHRLDPP